MDAIIVGSTIKGIETALLLAKQGYRAAVFCSGTYFGEDVTQTWKWYPQSRQAELYDLLSGVSERFGLQKPEKGALTPGSVKRLLAAWLAQAEVSVFYMTRVFGAAVYQNKVTGLVAADKSGLWYMSCRFVVDATLYGQATRSLAGSPLQIMRGHPITLHMELNGVNCGQYPCALEECDAILLKGIRDEKQAFLEAVRPLPREMSLREARSFLLAEAGKILSKLREYPETAEAMPADAFPLALDMPEPNGVPRINLDGWHSSVPKGMPAGKEEPTLIPDRLLVNGSLLPFSMEEDQKVIVDYERLTQKDTELLVAGAGTAGFWAAVSAAEEGVRVCVAEQFPYPGGTRTVGGMNGLYYGNRNRLFSDMWKKIRDYAQNVLGRSLPKMHQGMELLYYQKELTRLCQCLMTNVTVCGAETDEAGVLKRVLCCGEDGVFVVAAQRFIDATGEGDIARLTGCRFYYGDDEMHIMQNYSQFRRCAPNRKGYRAVDQDVMDQTRRREWTRALEWNLASLADYDLYDMLTVRESRRIKGKEIITMEDIVREKRTPNMIYEAYCCYDPHGRCLNIAGRLGLMPVQKNPSFVAVPLGALLPEDISGLLVAGKAISADQDAFNYIRMCSDVMSVGWIEGKLCAMSIKSGVPVEKLPLRDFQKQLLELGAITLPPPEQEVFGTSPEKITTEILAGEEKAFRDAVLTNWPQTGEKLAKDYENRCYSNAELAEKTLLWFGNSCGAKHLTCLLEQADIRMGEGVWQDRQKSDGVIAASSVGELNDYWRINQLVILLSRVKYSLAVPVILSVMRHTHPGGGWANHSSPYASIRLDCQSIVHYDRILCLAQAAVFMPDESYGEEFDRIYREVEELEAPAASFYQEYLQLEMIKAMESCRNGTYRRYLQEKCKSRYSVIAEYAQQRLCASR